MKRRQDRKRTRRARTDPNQLGLFDGAGPAPALKPPPPQASRKAGAGARADRAAVLNTREAAAYLGVSVSTLRAWRRRAVGPPHTMLGARMVGYQTSLLDAWLSARTVSSDLNTR